MLIIGHRGAKGLAPENTLASFQAALDANVDGVEFDVRVTADKVPIIFHDAKIGKVPLSRLTLDELRKQHTDLLTLDDLLRFLQNKTRLVIEIKPRVTATPVVDCLQQHLDSGLDTELITISSFDYKLLQAVKQQLPNVTLAVNEAWSGVRASSRARRLGTKYVTMNQKWLWGGFIKSVARSGYKLSTYTLNNPVKAKKWQGYGLYAVITDYPDQYKI